MSVRRFIRYFSPFATTLPLPIFNLFFSPCPVAEKIELFIGETLTDPSEFINNQVELEKVQFILLGHVTLSTNLNTGFKVRELKSISMECTGTFLKLLVHRNYVNKYNPQHQVAYRYLQHRYFHSGVVKALSS